MYTSNHLGYYYVDVVNRFAYKVSETLTYDSKLHEELVKTANALGIQGQPRVFSHLDKFRLKTWQIFLAKMNYTRGKFRYPVAVY